MTTALSGGIGAHFVDLHRRYSSLFQIYKRDISRIAKDYPKGLIQAKKKDMECMAAAAPYSTEAWINDER